MPDPCFVMAMAFALWLNTRVAHRPRHQGLPAVHARVDNAMIKAVACAFRWRKLLETGVHGTIEEIAAAERINTSHISRIRIDPRRMAPARYNTGRDEAISD